MDDDQQRTPELDFGPSGYLPERASKRARKIVLRAPLGAQWIVASLVAGVVVLIAGLLFLNRTGAPPPEPWEPVAELADVGTSLSVPDEELLLVGGAGRIRAFPADAEVAYCDASNRLEAADGRVWSLTGRGLGGADSLDEFPSQVHDGTLYVDRTRQVEGPAPSDDEVAPACH